ncbi:MAG: hypothetical protein HQL93_02630 [Magnetococcales bacterium]|nr:hypothetical protein [Magnetococcales bacterium]
MAHPTPTHSTTSYFKLIAWGGASLTMYAFLLFFEQPILALTSQGKWFFIFPVLIAFAFSIVHGNFTAEFWERLGFRANK